jgi:TolA-binding protein
MVLSAPAAVKATVVALAIGDVIMTSAGLNATLKKMERLTQEIARPDKRAREEALFQLGVEGDALAALMNQEVESHGMEERQLIDLALSRTKALGVAIAYRRDKKKFFYDGAAFRDYVRDAPAGAHAADAEFALLSYQFYQSESSEPAAVAAAADVKKRFLARYPRYKGNPEVSLFLAVDYRDLYRHYADARDTASAAKYRRLARGEYQRIARQYPGTEQASAAKQLLRRFDEETRQ